MDKSVQIFFYLFNLLLIIIILILAINKYTYGFLFIFSCWSLSFSLLYYVFAFILLVFRKAITKRNETMKNFFSKKLFKIVWTFNVTTVLGFWGGVELNWIAREKGWDNKDLWLQLFLHTFIPIFVFFDLFIFDHVLELSFVIDSIILTFLFWLYAILYYINKLIGKNQGVHIYYINDNFIHNFVIVIIYYMLYLNCYFFHQFILMKKMNVTINTNTFVENTTYTTTKKNILINKK